MAIYRSEQAVVSFGAEAALGGYPEGATTVTTASDSAILDGAHVAGSRILTVSDHSALAVGNFIRIGTATTNCEVRKIVGIADSNTTYYLDAPTSVLHPDDAPIIEVSAVTDTDFDKYITYIPGIYDTVDTPEMVPTIEPRYFLGSGAKRNFTAAYKGTQSYNGSVGSFILLNAAALRFPFGTIATTPSAIATDDITVDMTTAGAAKGNQYIALTTGGDVAQVAAGDYFQIGSGADSEVIRAVTESSDDIRLATPLRFAHADDAALNEVAHAGGGITYTHIITESDVLDSISMNVHLLDTDETTANTLERRFYGGKVGSATISAEEGGLLVMGWDSISFMGMTHNQKLDPNSAITGGDVPFHSLTQSIPTDNVGLRTGGTTVPTFEYPSGDPYYFSEGTVSIFGTTFASVRNFSISVNNNIEPRYYIERRGDARLRGPSDLVETRREYTMSATIVLPDTVNATTSDTTSLFKQLLMEGDYGAGMKGFNIQLVFSRGTNDTITIDIPDDGTAAVGLNQQGAYLTEAPHPIDGSNPLEVSASMMFRNMKITIVDSVPLYP
ncbi:hypothetical protein CMI37_22475 [Candidatus Pacearchaeota archaeon]|nr:hypothetical protein [Candidatus Pacearchaeota archaeon]|tara:strand:+ start:391 stop:2064 length:1674 start_codon:yes stop_codon:yes gene_type:complete